MRRLCSISVIAAIAIAGCGSSTNHSSEWTKAKIASIEGEFDNTTGAANFTSTQRACFLKGVEAHFSPTTVEGQASGGQQQQVKSILKGCGLQVGSSSTDPTSTSGKTYGPACQKQFDSAACAEEQEKTIGEAERQGEVKRSEEEKEENKGAEEEITFGKPVRPVTARD